MQHYEWVEICSLNKDLKSEYCLNVDRSWNVWIAALPGLFIHRLKYWTSLAIKTKREKFKEVESGKAKTKELTVTMHHSDKMLIFQRASPFVVSPLE